MLFICSTAVLIRHLWQLKAVVLLHWCLIRAVLLKPFLSQILVHWPILTTDITTTPKQGATTLSIITLCRKALSTTILNIMGLFATISITVLNAIVLSVLCWVVQFLYCYAECRFANNHNIAYNSTTTEAR